MSNLNKKPSPSIAEKLSALANTSKFAAFFKGKSIVLPNDDKLELRIISIKRTYLGKGFNFAKYSFVTEVQAGEIREVGYGESEDKIIAFEKSIAEAIERAVFRVLKNKGVGTETTNGWAVHTSAKLARANSSLELLERDAILTHWLMKIPMREICQPTFPEWLESWKNSEFIKNGQFRDIKLFVSTIGHVPTVTVIFKNDRNHGVAGHAADSSLEMGIYKAMTECCRIASVVENVDLRKSSRTLKNLKALQNNQNLSPVDHAMFYAHHMPIPGWLSGCVIDFETANMNWANDYKKLNVDNLKATFTEISNGPLCIGYSSSPQIQNLFFGSTVLAMEKGLINFSRLRFLNLEGVENFLPHFIA